MSTDKPLIFISCGQQTPEEQSLGKQIVELIRNLDLYEPYYAQNEQSLDGVTENILSKLYKASGLIVVMHNRGNVQTRSKTFVRGSVWIEQEIGIAAFVRQVLKRDIEIMAFVQQGLQREGIRDFILGNPTEFSTEDEVITALHQNLPTWQLTPIYNDKPLKFPDLDGKQIDETKKHYADLGREVSWPSWINRDAKLAEGYEVAYHPTTRQEIWAGCRNDGTCEHILMVKPKGKL